VFCFYFFTVYRVHTQVCLHNCSQAQSFFARSILHKYNYLKYLLPERLSAYCTYVWVRLVLNYRMYVVYSVHFTDSHAAAALRMHTVHHKRDLVIFTITASKRFLMYTRPSNCSTYKKHTVFEAEKALWVSRTKSL
jgi:hypothetical protein